MRDMLRTYRAVLTFLLILLTPGFPVQAQKPDEADFESFEDSLLILTQLSEQITIDRLSLRSFRCEERLHVIETVVKSKSVRQHQALHSYTVERKPDQRVNDKLIFSETRSPASGESAAEEDSGFPLLENPFTGKWIEAFSLENRLANDFKKLPSEQVDGRSCQLFAFETVPEISGSRITILGNLVPLRQRGRVWVDAKTHQLVRLVAKQLKLPKGCRSYEYRMEFRNQALFGRSLSIPVRAELKIELKDRVYGVVQEYSKFEAK